MEQVDRPVIEWTPEDLDRAFLMMKVLAKNMEFVGNMMTTARSGNVQNIDKLVADLCGFLTRNFKGVDGMKDELIAFARQLGVDMQVHVVRHPTKGPPN